VQGWLYNRRSSKKLQFLQVRDGTGIVQGIVSLKDAGEELFERAGASGQEASVRVAGSVKLDERAPGGVPRSEQTNRCTRDPFTVLGANLHGQAGGPGRP